MSTKKTHDEFAQVVLDAWQKTPPDNGTLYYDKDDFCILVKDGLGVPIERVNLANYYIDFCNATTDDEVNAIIETATSSVLELGDQVPDTYEEARDNLYPHIQDPYTTAQSELQLGHGGPDIHTPFFHVAGTFAVVMAYDLPKFRVILSSDTTDRWDVDFEQVLSEAVHRLYEISHTEYGMYEDQEHVYYSTWHDGYDASRILVPELWQSLEVNGDHVIFVPNSDLLIITGSNDLEGLRMGLGELQAAAEKRRPLPPIPLVYIDNEVQRFILSKDHELYWDFARLENMHFNQIYSDQKELLERTFESLTNEYFVAKYVLLEDPEGKTFSASTLTDDGVATLLPETDYIYFVRVTGEGEDDGEILAIGSLARVVEIAGDIFEETSFYPPRFKAVKFPTEEQLAKIGMEEPLDDD